MPEPTEADILALGESLIDAVQALMDFSDAMDEGQHSILDLERGLKCAIAGGWDMLEVKLIMARMAVERCKEIRHA